MAEELWWGIKPVHDESPWNVIAWSHWSQRDAAQAAAYNSERWGKWEVCLTEVKNGGSK